MTYYDDSYDDFDAGYDAWKDEQAERDEMLSDSDCPLDDSPRKVPARHPEEDDPFFPF